MSIESSTPPLRALVVGAGPAAQAMHLPVLAKLRDAKQIDLAMICDLDPKRAAAAQQGYGFRETSADAAAAIARSDFDVVYLFGSAQLHHRSGLLALRTGKHVFVEKPIAPSYAEALTLVEAARASGRIAVGAHNRRFYESLRAVRALAGKTRWRYAEAVFHKPEFARPPPYGVSTWLGANGIHALDALLFMMGGPPSELQSMASQTAMAAPSAFAALMRWPDGAQGVFLCNNDAGGRREEYVFHGLGETVRASEQGLSCERGGRLTTTPYPWLGDGIEAEHRAFLASVHGGHQPLHALEALAPSLRVAELIEMGHSGAVSWPAEPAAEPATFSAVSDRAENSCIALTALPSLMAAVAEWLPDLRTTSLEDVRSNANSRPDIVAVMLSGAAAIGEAELDKLPNLVVVGVHGLSLTHYEPQRLLARGIALVNAEAAYAESVAEFALGLMILGRRRAFSSHAAMRDGGWGTQSAGRLKDRLHRLARALRPALRAAGLERRAAKLWQGTLGAGAPDPTLAATRDLRGASVALIGWASNACALTRRLLAAGAHVAVYSQHASRQDILAAGARSVSLGECLAADVVSLHRGLTKDTRHFLGAAELERLRPGTLLVNVARGGLIEPHALLARLKRGDIFACLDTYDEEPLASDHPLRALPNVFLTAHIAGSSPELRAAAAQEVAGKIARVLRGDAEPTLAAQRLSTMT